MTYFVYMLRCEDNSLYTGITTDIRRRFGEHAARNGKGAKYTSVHRAAAVAAAWETNGGRSAASKLEYYIKHLRKADKEMLALQPQLLSRMSGIEVKIADLNGG